MRNSILFSALAVVMTVSCQQETGDKNLEGEAKIVTIDVAMDQKTDDIAMDQETESRVAIDNSAWKATWEEGDSLIATQSDVDQPTNYSQVIFYMTGEFDPNLATFSGKVYSYDTDKIRFTHTNNTCPTMVKDEMLSYSFDVAIQDGTLNKTMLVNDQAINVSDLVNSSIAEFTPVMQHVGGYMTVKVSFDNFVEGYTLTQLRYCNVPTVATLPHLSSIDDLVIGDNTGAITVNLDTPIEITGESATVDLNILPFEIADGDEIKIELQFRKENKLYEAKLTKQNTTGSTLSFERAKYNTTNITCDMAADITPAAASVLEMSYFSFEGGVYDMSHGPYDELAIKSLPQSNIWTITDESIANFGNLFMALETAESVSRYIQLYFPNLTELTAYFGGLASPRAMDLPKLEAISGSKFAPCSDYLEYISIPSVKSITGGGAFAGCTLLKEMNLPNATIIGPDFLTGCTGIKKISIATAKDVMITEIAPSAFHGLQTKYITLTIGGYHTRDLHIEGNTITIRGATDADDRSYTFAEIIEYRE